MLPAAALPDRRRDVPEAECRVELEPGSPPPGQEGPGVVDFDGWRYCPKDRGGRL